MKCHYVSSQIRSFHGSNPIIQRKETFSRIMLYFVIFQISFRWTESHVVSREKAVISHHRFFSPRPKMIKRPHLGRFRRCIWLHPRAQNVSRVLSVIAGNSQFICKEAARASQETFNSIQEAPKRERVSVHGRSLIPSKNTHALRLGDEATREKKKKKRHQGY